jgi:hypothetical protein
LYRTVVQNVLSFGKFVKKIENVGSFEEKNIFHPKVLVFFLKSFSSAENVKKIS